MPKGTPAPHDDDAIRRRLVQLFDTVGVAGLSDAQLRQIAGAADVLDGYRVGSAQDELERRATEREAEQDNADAEEHE